MKWLNQLEPDALLNAFQSIPPEGIEILDCELPIVFGMPFGLLTTVEDDVKKKLQRLKLYTLLSKILRIRTAFVGTTVSEYTPILKGIQPEGFVEKIGNKISPTFKLIIIKDLPQQSPLLREEDNNYADMLVKACEARDYIILEGQALAYVPINFDTFDSYLSGLSAGRRRNLRRKLKISGDVSISQVNTGGDYFNEERLDEYYRMYQSVYRQSEIHFDYLTRDFFNLLFRDEESMGMVFEYYRRKDNKLVGWNLCYEYNGNLVDKYIGFKYPDARELNLYFLSWVNNIKYSLERGLSNYIAGWTDPEVKASLGADFTFTRHAVLVRNPLLRKLARKMSGNFENDFNKLNARCLQ